METYFFLTGEYVDLAVIPGAVRPVWIAKERGHEHTPSFQGAMSFWEYRNETPPRYFALGPVRSGSPIFGIATTDDPLHFLIRRGLFLGTVNDARTGLDKWHEMKVPLDRLEHIAETIPETNLHTLGINYDTATICLRTDVDVVSVKMII